MTETDHTKDLVFALYDKTSLTPQSVIEIERENVLVHIGIYEPFFTRAIMAIRMAFALIKYKGCTISYYIMEEKTGKEIADWYAGKGLR